MYLFKQKQKELKIKLVSVFIFFFTNWKMNIECIAGNFDFLWHISNWTTIWLKYCQSWRKTTNKQSINQLRITSKLSILNFLFENEKWQKWRVELKFQFSNWIPELLNGCCSAFFIFQLKQRNKKKMKNATQISILT